LPGYFQASSRLNFVNTDGSLVNFVELDAFDLVADRVPRNNLEPVRATAEAGGLSGGESPSSPSHSAAVACAMSFSAFSEAAKGLSILTTFHRHRSPSHDRRPL